ncbi:CHASE2 domain-containing protein [Vibrio sp. SCSIO 43136]|uniref:CHASE2 domain-containing protein n=1 Tax=Vibrio sp. SCSIO 43136 TaxID=2819101 RepID=UPI002074BE50|nr:CHASE2 domain-containing protein [Vibrio sp. SCSIO 43136]USD67204.1 CHASE2 domain-containing protein [Vibrio sp. SCSIO 43136]
MQVSLISQVKRGLKAFYLRFTFSAQWLFMFVLGAWLIYGDPYGLGSASERAGEKAIYRLVSGQYDATASHDKLLVVLFNDKAIANLYPNIWQSNDWPLSYLDQANLISTLMAQSPSALFYDVMWMKKRSLDPTYDRAVAKLSAMHQLTQVPLFFARGTANSSFDSTVATDLSEFATLVANGWEGEGDLYPVFVDDSTPTTATALYNHYCQSHDCDGLAPDDSASMSVRWNSNAADILLPHRIGECRERGNLIQVLGRAAWSVVQNIVPIFEEPQTLQICPPQRLLYADELMAMVRSPIESEREQVRAWVKDAIVLVGGQIEGVHDYVVSPVHGALPGVFFHAMALDNLLVYQDSYTREDDNVDHVNFAIWMIYISLLIAVRTWVLEVPLFAWLNERLWVLSGVFILLVLGIVFGWFHYAPSSWISILALGWAGIQLIEKIESEYGLSPEEEQPNDEK